MYPPRSAGASGGTLPAVRIRSAWRSTGCTADHSPNLGNHGPVRVSHSSQRCRSRTEPANCFDTLRYSRYRPDCSVIEAALSPSARRSTSSS